MCVDGSFGEGVSDDGGDDDNDGGGLRRRRRVDILRRAASCSDAPSVQDERKGQLIVNKIVNAAAH